MSVSSSSTNLTEVAGVNNAVQHLQELGKRMKDYDFREKDLQSINGIVEALNDLQNERGRIQQELEVETIEASILRHRLQFLPEQVTQEISVAVNSARESNTAELGRLREILDGVNGNIDFLENKHKDLEEENSILHPERDKVRQDHEEIIMQLNHRLAEKAGKQIVLNETRDKLRETNQKIVDMEEAILQLKEDLIQERADARMEKKRLKKAVYDTTLKTREQKDSNIAKKKEVDEIHIHVIDSETELNKIRKIIRRLETSKQRLENQEKALVTQLRKETKQNQELRLVGSDIARQIEAEETDFKGKEIGLDEKIKKLDALLKEEEEKNAVLNTKKDGLQQDLNGKLKISQQDDRRVKEANAELQNAKIRDKDKAEQVAEVTLENEDIEVKIQELLETHNSFVEVLNRQIDEAREQLAKERKERVELQGERQSVQKEVEDFKQKTNKEMNEISRKINEGKQMHDELTKEGTQLQRALRKDDETIKKLKAELQTAKDTLVQVKEKLLKELGSLEAAVVALEKSEAEKKDLIATKTPIFESLDKEFEDTGVQYEVTKKEIVKKKNLMNGLKESVKRATREIEKLANPKIELEESIKTRRVDMIELLKEQSLVVRDQETKIYTIGCKLKTAIEENDRFREANELMENDIIDLTEQTKDNIALMEKFRDIILQYRQHLATEWIADHELEREYSKRDEVLVVELGEVLENTEKREKVISGITDKLEDELALLAKFLDNVASRRPKTEQKKMREAQLAAASKDSMSELSLNGSTAQTVAFTEPSTGRVTTARTNTARTNTARKNKTKTKTPRNNAETDEPNSNTAEAEEPRPVSVQKYSPLPPITPTKDLSPSNDSPQM